MAPERSLQDSRNLEADLELAISLATGAGELALGHFRSSALEVERKADMSLVTQADRASEAFIRNALADARPDDGVIGEEEGAEGADRPWQWLIDPIDGTHNFARGVSVWAVLLALVDPSRVPVVGVVVAPALGASWWAARGSGAYRNGDAVAVSSTEALADAFVSVTPTDAADHRGMAAFRLLVRTAWRVRGFGDFWQHCLVAEGSLDGCIDVVGVKPYDLAAVRVIVEEAGGRFSDRDGRLTHESGSAMSSNGRLHQALLGALSAGDGSDRG